MGFLDFIVAGLTTAIGVAFVVVGINTRPTAQGEVWMHRVPRSIGPAAGAAARRPFATTLVRSGLRLSEAQLWMATAAAAVAGGLLGWLAAGLNPLTLVFAVAAGLIPYAVVRRLATNRTRKIERQLPAVMLSIADILRAGRSLPMAIEEVGRTAGPPLGEEFARASREVMMGGTVEEAIAAMAERTAVRDLQLLSTAISVVRVSGGDMPRMLTSMAAVARARRALAAQVRAMTSQARGTSWALSLMPVFVGAVGYLAAPSYFGVLTTTSAGWALLTLAALLITMGQLAIRGIMAQQTR